MKKIGKSSLSVGLSAAFVASATIPSAVAESNPFAATPLASGYEIVNQAQHQPVETKNFKEGKCGEGKCGEGKCGGASPIDGDKTKRKGKVCDGSKKAAKEGKCGEGKCGEGKCGGKAEAKQFTEGKFGKEKTKGKVCDGSKKAAKEGKCGEGKCGEGKCGGDK